MDIIAILARSAQIDGPSSCAVDQAAESIDAGSDPGAAPHGWGAGLRWWWGDRAGGVVNLLPEPGHPLSEGITKTGLQGCLSWSPGHLGRGRAHFSWTGLGCP